ncbi:unnamed protein product [Heterobilharzia americana]|nr:unnamed protein product [Heterobilharzia americana]
MDSKESSSDLLSRYKARKMLGVGESSGNVVSSKVAQILGETNEPKLDIQHISCIYYWNYFMAILIMSCGLILVGSPTSYNDWFIQRLFPISDIHDNLNSLEFCGIQRPYNTQFVFKNFGCLHITLALSMFYAILLIKPNGIYVSQFISFVYASSSLTVHLLTKQQFDQIMYIYTLITMITFIFYIKLVSIQAKGWIFTGRNYLLNSLKSQNTNYPSTNETAK